MPLKKNFLCHAPRYNFLPTVVFSAPSRVRRLVTVSKQECFRLERIGIFPIIDSLDRLPYLRLSLPLKPGFHMIVGDRSRSLGSQEKRSAIVTIIRKPNFHFASNHQRSQRLPTIATITIAGIESESISAIVAIVNDRQWSQKVTQGGTRKNFDRDARVIF